MCDLLTTHDTKVINVALDALEHLLEFGRKTQLSSYLPENPVAAEVESVDGLTKLEALQTNHSEDIYLKVVKLVETHFQVDDDSALDATGGQEQSFNFGAFVPQGGFNFGS